jgi:hypothetical protein
MATVSFPEIVQIPSVPPQATLCPGRFEDLVFEVSYGVAVWEVVVVPADSRPRTRPEAVLHPQALFVNGEAVAWRVGDFPEGPATTAVEAEMRRLWATSLRVPLIAAGFHAPPTERTGRTRNGQSDAELVVRARRALDDPHRAMEEKLLTRARKRDLLQGRPHAHAFTAYGQELLDAVDSAGSGLLRVLHDKGGTADVLTFGPHLVNLGFTIDVVNAAIGHLASSRRIHVLEWADAAQRRCHQFVAHRLQVNAA